MRILKLSPVFGNNIGDLAISDVFEDLIESLGHEVISKDWRGRPRDGFQNRELPRGRNFAGKLLYRVPEVGLGLSRLLRLNPYSFGKLVESFGYEPDAVILGGGNLLMDTFGTDYLHRVLCYAEYFRNKRIPVYILGVGAGGISGRRSEQVGRVVELAKAVVVRDVYSLGLLKSFLSADLDRKVELVPDVVLSHRVRLPESDHKFVGLNVAGTLTDLQITGVKRCIDFILEYFQLPLKIIITAYPLDREVGLSVLDYCRGQGAVGAQSEIVFMSSAWRDELAPAFLGIKFFLGSRMHSLIFSMITGTPCMGITWHPKVDSLFEMVGLGNLGRSSSSPEELIGALAQLDWEAERTRLATGVAVARVRIQDHYRGALQF